MLWTANDVLTERMAVAQFCELEIGSQREIATAFQISGKTVYRYRQIFAAEGSAGLLGEKKGPKNRWKITKEIRSDILYLFFIEQLVTYEQIRRRLARWGKEVGITSIREVLLENGLIRQMSVFDDLVNRAELFHNEETDRQLRLDFDCAEEAREVKKIGVLRPVGEKPKANVFGQAAVKPRRYYSLSQRMYLDQLKQGVYSAYAGGLLYTPFLRQYPFFAWRNCAGRCFIWMCSVSVRWRISNASIQKSSGR